MTTGHLNRINGIWCSNGQHRVAIVFTMPGNTVTTDCEANLFYSNMCWAYPDIFASTAINAAVPHHITVLHAKYKRVRKTCIVKFSGTTEIENGFSVIGDIPVNTILTGCQSETCSKSIGDIRVIGHTHPNEPHPPGSSVEIQCRSSN